MNSFKSVNEETTQTVLPDELSGGKTRAIIEAINELIVLTNAQGVIEAINNRLTRMYESDNHQLIGTSIYTVLPESLSAQTRNIIDTALKNGTAVRHESEVDGFFFEIDAYPVPNNYDGSPKIALFFKDITREHKYKETILESEKKYRQIVDTANEGICVTDKEFKLIFINKRGQEMFEMSEEEVLGKHVDYFIYPEDLEHHRVKLHQRVQGLRDRYERRFRKMNGKPVWAIVSASPFFDRKDHFAGSIFLLTDITKRKIVEEAVQESEERYRTAIESSNDGVAMIRGETLIYVNKTFVDMFGYSSADELIGQNQSITIYPDEGNGIAESNKKRRKRDRDVPERYEFKGIRKDGTLIDVEVSATRTQYRGEVVYLAYLRDITARKHIENELLNMRKLESIGILAGGIAHDFNNLLMSILGYVSLAKLYMQSGDSKAKEKLIEAKKTIDKARELTARLLTFSKGGSPLKKVFKIQPVIKETSHIVLSGSNIVCQYEFQNNLWKVKADELQLRQVVRQLVQNAMEAMPDGGSLTISARNILAGIDQNVSFPAGRYVELRIKDTGKGITKEYLPRVFDPYYTTKDFSSQKGMGLGLAVCYSIIKKHGGQIDVESELNEGTTFTVHLPAHEPEPDAGPETIPVSEKEVKPVRKLKILIADDEKSILQTTTMLLTYLGHNVTATLNGTDAIELYRKSMEAGESFDLVILDLVSPGGLGGVRILDELLKIDPEVCAILSSGYPDDPQIVNYEKHGFKGVLVKPYKMEDLNLAIATALALKSN